MKYFIKVVNNSSLIDRVSLNEIFLSGFNDVQSVSKSKIYSITGTVSMKEIKYICENLLVDPVIEQYQINKFETFKNGTRVNIWYKPLVLDVVAKNIEIGIKYLGINKELEIHSGSQITIFPKIDKKITTQIIKKIFMNELIQKLEIVQ
ncbi:MAG: phosphoribosylformylglycinamidine synthase subunit PurS [Endomicrobiia bacterium]